MKQLEQSAANVAALPQNQNQDEVLDDIGKGACEGADFRRSWKNHIQQ